VKPSFKRTIYGARRYCESPATVFEIQNYRELCLILHHVRNALQSGTRLPTGGESKCPDRNSVMVYGYDVSFGAEASAGG
jgi:hypothetical protein